MRVIWMILMLFVFSVSAALAATQQAVLSWPDLSNETGYKVERKTGTAGTFAQIGTTLANVVTYTDGNLPQGSTFCWRVSGTNALGDGPPSDEVCSGTAGVPGKVGTVTVIIQIVP